MYIRGADNTKASSIRTRSSYTLSPPFSGSDDVPHSKLSLTAEEMEEDSAKNTSALTPSQLAKKRETDRKAQRNRRERTRMQIATLERQLAEISSANFYKELQQVKEEKKVLEGENAQIKKRLGTIKSLMEEVHVDQEALASVPPVLYVSDASLSPSFSFPFKIPETLPFNHFTRQCQADEDLSSQDSSHFILKVDDRLSLDIRVHQAITDEPAHVHPILNTPAEIPLDRLLLNFIAERRKLIANGMSKELTLGPQYPSFEPLLDGYETSTCMAKPHPLSEVLTDILRTFSDLSTLPEQMAVLYIMFLLMRWQIDPSLENYDRLPSWFTPRASQLFESHPAWIDQTPFPRLRDQLVREHLQYSFDDFCLPFTNNLSLNWQYEPMDTLLQLEGGVVIMNPVFEQHIRNGANWKLGPGFMIALPGLADAVKGEIIPHGKSL